MADDVWAEMNKKIAVYDFADFPSLLAGSLEWLKQANPKASLRWIAKRLGLKSHTFLLRLTRGDKVPSDELFAKFAALFGWSVDEYAYAKALLALSLATKPDERDFLLRKLDDLRREVPGVLLQLDAFESIAHWYHLAVFELSRVEGFSGNVEWIAQRLGNAVSPEVVRDSLDRLLRLGLLRDAGDGRIERAVSAFTTPNNVPSAAIRSFHSQMLDRAKDALDAVPLAQRYFFGHTMPVDRSKLALAQDLIIEFRARFHKLMESKNPDSVYHLAVQFIPLTAPDDPNERQPGKAVP